MSFRRFKKNFLNEHCISICRGGSSVLCVWEKSWEFEKFGELRSERVRCIVKTLYFLSTWEENYTVQFHTSLGTWYGLYYDWNFRHSARQLLHNWHSSYIMVSQNNTKTRTTRASSIQLFFSSKSTVFQLPLASNMTFLVDKINTSFSTSLDTIDIHWFSWRLVSYEDKLSRT